jgi:hypothetical protein
VIKQESTQKTANLIKRKKLRYSTHICLAVLIVTVVALSVISGGCSSARKVQLGVNNVDTITSSDPDEGEDLGGGVSSRWWYHSYTLNVEAGHMYTFTLTTHNGVTTGIWSEDKGSWIVEVNYSQPTRTATYSFQHSGNQKLWVEAAEVPAEYSWYVTR